MRQFFSTHSVTTALALVALYFVILALPAIGQSDAFGGNPEQSPHDIPLDQLTTEVFLVISALVFVFVLGWGKSARVTSRPDWGGLWYLIPPAAFYLLVLEIGFLRALRAGEADFDVLWASGLIQNLAVLVVFIGIFEEVLFRGILLNGLERRIGAVKALFLSSAIFGAMHYVNFVLGQSLEATHPQVLHAGLAGVLYGAVALRTNSIWPGVFLHASWDLIVALNGAFANATTTDATNTTWPEATFVFVFQNFEPIMGVIILFAFLRHEKKRRAAAHQDVAGCRSH